jgi:hypothetical protein
VLSKRSLLAQCSLLPAVVFTAQRSLDTGFIGIYPLDAKAPILWMPTESIPMI